MKQLYQRIEMDKTSKKKMKPSQNTTEVCHKIISNDCTHGEYVFEQKKGRLPLRHPTKRRSKPLRSFNLNKN